MVKNSETEKEYWKQFYEKNKNLNSTPSNFCIFVDKYFKDAAKDLFVLDAGCGNGRDSYFLSRRYNVRGIDISVTPESNESVSFLLGDFCSVDKDPYDIIYSRFTFHSITNEQHLEFFESIKKSGTYLCIETRSDLDRDNHRHHGDDHYRNFTNSAYLKELVKKYNFDILYFEEDKNFAKYKDENPICIRTICIKR